MAKILKNKEKIISHLADYSKSKEFHKYGIHCLSKTDMFFDINLFSYASYNRVF